MEGWSRGALLLQQKKSSLEETPFFLGKHFPSPAHPPQVRDKNIQFILRIDQVIAMPPCVAKDLAAREADDQYLINTVILLTLSIREDMGQRAGQDNRARAGRLRRKTRAGLRERGGLGSVCSRAVQI